MLGSKLFARLRPFRLYIDRPQSGEIFSAISVIHGWFRWKPGTPAPELKINGKGAVWVAVDRPDVKRSYPGQSSQGFQAVLDTTRLPPDNASRKAVDLQLSTNGEIVARQQLRLTENAIEEGQAADAHRRSKRQWLEEHVACPLCARGISELAVFDGRMHCRRCGQVYPDNQGALDFLPEDLRDRFHIEHAEDISAHLYDEVAVEIVEDVQRKRGKVLDCGSGMRPRVDETVICMDVSPFPSVDVLAVNQRLPFRDAVFDAVLSLNVLEHVTDPFACASELVRVLKPGGILYCCVPFLQPEHGYPHHYFNATRSGLRHLFPSNLEVLQHVVPRSGEPIWTLHWFLSWYAAQLPAKERDEFLNLQIKDILEEPAQSLLDERWVVRLSEEGKWKLASTTAAVFRKPPQ